MDAPMVGYLVITFRGQYKQFWPFDCHGDFLTTRPVNAYNFGVWLLCSHRHVITVERWVAIGHAVPSEVRDVVFAFAPILAELMADPWMKVCKADSKK